MSQERTRAHRSRVGVGVLDQEENSILSTASLDKSTNSCLLDRVSTDRLHHRISLRRQRVRCQSALRARERRGSKHVRRAWVPEDDFPEKWPKTRRPTRKGQSTKDFSRIRTFAEMNSK